MSQTPKARITVPGGAWPVTTKWPLFLDEDTACSNAVDRATYLFDLIILQLSEVIGQELGCYHSEVWNREEEKDRNPLGCNLLASRVFLVVGKTGP